MKICFVGSSNTVFTHSYLSFFNEISEDIFFIDIAKGKSQHVDSISPDNLLKLYCNKANGNEKSFIKKIFASIKFDRNPLFIFFINLIDLFKRLPKDKTIILHEFIKKKEPDYIIYFWGTTVRTEKKALDAYIKDTSIKSILIVNTYPVRSNVEKDCKYFTSFLDYYFFKSFDGISFPSEEMRLFFEKNNLPYNNYQILPDFLSKNFQSTTKPNLVVNKNKKLIFLGNTDFSFRTIDNVYNELLSISNLGVEVWLQSSDDIEFLLKENPNVNLKTFNPFTYNEMLNGHLSLFLKQFDGIIMIYNGLNNARTATGYPTRFALALFSGKPIFVRTNTFLSLENKFRGIVFPYNDHVQLMNRLLTEVPIGTDFSLFLDDYNKVWCDFLDGC